MQLIPFLLLLAGAAIVVVLHALRPDVHPTAHYISEYGNETWSWLLMLALALIALGLLCLAATIRDTIGARAAPRLMRLSAAMLMVAALFSTDRQAGEIESATLAGQLHGLSAVGAFCVLILAMAMLSPRLEGNAEQLGRASVLAVPLAAAGLVAVSAAFLVVPEAHGLRQRAFLAPVFGWLLAIAFQIGALAQTDRRGSGTRPSTGDPEHVCRLGTKARRPARQARLRPLRGRDGSRSA